MTTPDIVILGGSLGGVMAAVQAAQALRMRPASTPMADGPRIVLVAEGGWLGGQMTAQAVPPDEHPAIEAGGATKRYLAFREAMRAHYRQQPGFRDGPTMTGGTNPGDGWVSRLCLEPAVAAAWFDAQLQPLVDEGLLRIDRGWRAVQATTRGACVDALRLQDAQGQQRWLGGRMFIDATDTGELLALAGLAHRVGKESRAEFNEPDAPIHADPLDQQPITQVMALRWQAEPGQVALQPPSYGFWRERRVPHHDHLQFSLCLPAAGGRTASLPLTGCGPTLDWWRYRRIVSAAQWGSPRDAAHASPAQPGPAQAGDVTLVNWAQNDYALHPLIEGPQPESSVRQAARELSLALLHWLHTEAPRPDGGRGWPEWQPAPDITGTPDGLAQQAYVRESRRIVARSTFTQRDLMQPPAQRQDSVGIAWYRMDIHPTCTSGHGLNAPAHRMELPLGAFIHRDGGNVVPGCKNIGVTHLVNACTRVHPAEWLIGEVAGRLAAWRCLHDWPEHPAEVAAFRADVASAGIPLHWPQTPEGPA